jgi:hypothetical protein
VTYLSLVTSAIGNNYARFWGVLDTVAVTSFYVYIHEKILEVGLNGYGHG